MSTARSVWLRGESVQVVCKRGGRGGGGRAQEQRRGRRTCNFLVIIIISFADLQKENLFAPSQVMTCLPTRGPDSRI